MRVLLAEDDARISRPLADALGAAGYTVEVESDGEIIWYRGDST